MQVWVLYGARVNRSNTIKANEARGRLLKTNHSAICDGLIQELDFLGWKSYSMRV